MTSIGIKKVINELTAHTASENVTELVGKRIIKMMAAAPHSASHGIYQLVVYIVLEK